MAKNIPATHHWWPKALQRYWLDKKGRINWVIPSGELKFKKNLDKVGSKRHGHTLFKNNLWESNFEKEFSIDNEINRIIDTLTSLKPLGRTPREFINLLFLIFKKDRSLKDMCHYYDMDEKTHRNLLALLYSLAIRSPARRFQYERTGMDWGFPPSEDMGKMNMFQHFMGAKRLFDQGSLSGHRFVILHSPMKKFCFGDGMFDLINTNLPGNGIGGMIGIGGRFLVALTPNLCVYFCTTNSRDKSKNTASISVAPWIVDWVNEIVQIYSGNIIFYSGKPPKITEHFKQGNFLKHNYRKDSLINMLDDVAGVKRPNPDLVKFFERKM